MRNKISKVANRVRGQDPDVEEGPKTPPRITNETVAEHREEVLSRARKYVYPLSHSKHKVVLISTSLFVTAVLVFFAYCLIALYKLQSTSSFLYSVTKIIPFPVAKAGSQYVSYESYLFELRHYMHYYQTQQQVDFNSTTGKQQLTRFQKQALTQVVDYAYIKQLADENHVTVSNQEVNREMELVRSQNRLGGSDQVFRDVLREFWGWSVGDFKRELQQEMLTQKVVAKLDTATSLRAKQALHQLNKKHGQNFAKLAAAVSGDRSAKASGGEYGILIDKTSRDVAPQVTAALFKLKPGQYSGIINTGYSLEIVKVISKQGTKVRAAHISFEFKSIDAYLKPLETQKPAKDFIKV